MIDFVTVATGLVSVLVYLAIKNREYRNNIRLGLLIYAYIRDINRLLINRMNVKWSRLSMPDKLDRLKSIYDLIDTFDQIDDVGPLPGPLEDLDNMKL